MLFRSSRFLEEINENYLDKSFAGNSSRNNSTSTWGQSSAFDRMRRGFGNNSTQQQPAVAKTSFTTPVVRTQPKEHVPSENFVASDSSLLQQGHKVEHQKFGYGQVIKLEGASHNPIATILFDINGEKKIMLNYAKLRIVDAP